MKKFLQGFIVGICNIIPGVCSATIAILVGVYEDIIDGISHLYNPKMIKKYFFLYLGIIIGILLGIVVLNYLYKRIPLILTLIFLGIVIRNYPIKFKNSNKKHNNYLLFFIGLIIVVGMYFLNSILFEINYDKFSVLSIIGIIVCSFLSGLAMILPGISGALMLMVFNLYFPLLSAVTGILNALLRLEFPNLNNLLLIFIFGASFISSIVLSSKGINRLIKEKPSQFGSIVNGMIVGSIINILLEIPNLYATQYQIIISIILFIIFSLVDFTFTSKHQFNNLKKTS